MIKIKTAGHFKKIDPTSVGRVLTLLVFICLPVSDPEAPVPLLPSGFP